jgi:hypothetical protein
MPSGTHLRALNPLLILPLASFLVVLPLLLHGCSCGQDQVFHLQSWLDAAQQLRHLHYPHWATTAAWNAGEPRFVFYPPLSWLLGALLTMLFPIAACPAIFILLATLTSGLTFHRLARDFVSPNAALLAAVVYLANPYMLFNAFERSAYAELLAAAWIPLLLRALLRPRPNVPAIAIPLALLWLTNAPAAVMGSYLLATIATLRVLEALILAIRDRNARPPSLLPAPYSPLPVPLALTYLAGTALGLALPAYYLIPAAYERKYVQVAMAIIPNMRFQDNFLFTRTADAAHNAVNHTASTLALTLLLLTATLVTFLLFKERLTLLSAIALHRLKATRTTPTKPIQIHIISPLAERFLTPTLALLPLLIAFLLTPLSTPIWNHLPELAFLQFPWRLLTLLSAILALALALLLNQAAHKGSRTLLLTLTLFLPLGLTFTAYHLYAQACDPHDTPTNIAALLSTHHGLGPTDEYTPTAADNDLLRSNNPAFWLLPANADPNTPAPNTTPTPSELNPNLDTDDTPIPIAQTLSTPTPHHFTIAPTQPSTLVLNLRNYPNWDIIAVGPDTMSVEHYPEPSRDDGVIALQLPPGQRTIAIHWRRTPDQTLGLAISLLALIVLAFLPLRPRAHPLPPSA